VNLIAQSANSRQNRADLGELRSALDQLLNVLEQPRSGQGDQGRHDEHHGHLRHGLAWGHDRHRDDADKKRSQGDDHRDDEKAGRKNRIGAMPGQPPQTASAKAGSRTASGVGDAGHAKHGAGTGAATARNLAPAGQNAGQQMNPPGVAKNGAGPGNTQAKNGAGRKVGNTAGNMANNNGNPNQPGGAPMDQGNPNGKPWEFGDRKDDHHHHHFGEARDAGDKRVGHDRQGQPFGNAKNGAGPQANQVRAKTGNGANTGGQNAKAPTQPAANNQAKNNAATNNAATQAYVNMLMHTNGPRAGQQTHPSPANNAQRPQGNSARQQAPQPSAGNSMTRSFHGFSNSSQVHAGNSVGQHFAVHPVHSGRR
jgi:hypothetical protein